jgi:hypothetical protein
MTLDVRLYKMFFAVQDFDSIIGTGIVNVYLTRVVTPSGVVS